MRSLSLFLAAVSFLLCSCSKKQNDETVPVSSSYSVVQVTNGGSIHGTVILSGEKPAVLTIETQKDQDVCGESHANPASIGNGSGITGCVVRIEHIMQGKAFTPKKYMLDQKGCEFTPHTQVIPLGSSVIISNSDAVLHNFHIRSGDKTITNEAQPEGSPEREVKMSVPGLLTVECDVHPWMKGVMFVAENPYYAVTDSSGVFNIADIPPGDYTLTLWRDNWDLREVKDNNGRIESYQWRPDLTKHLQVHIEAGKVLETQFTLP